MPRFRSYDTTELAYHVLGSGPPLVCLPGGPARASSYLGDLGGLGRDRTLLRLDLRGSGESAVPEDSASYRCDRLVDDVEAFRLHLGLDRMDLLAHSAGGNLAELYAARFPDRLTRLVLVTPGLRSVGVETVGFDEAIVARSTEWWYPEAKAAMEAWQEAAARGAAPDEVAVLRTRAAPFAYGRWDERARAHVEAEQWEWSGPAAAGYYAGFAPDVPAVRAALAELDAPVLIVAGALDPAPTPEAAEALAALFPRTEVAVQEAASHFPWMDDRSRFVKTVLTFLTDERLTNERLTNER
ncbi:alpha/beta hydrolase [Plantactinospora sp. S1510]|uniref:Alpha/beta hydrolase n=1 Tax=Plantactinospora alkalitolerans TaxID=2789879 RepID=A0ABS0GPP7_9ACTN|nr:alpha/beta hydrolase [Plantactinospora alkalitolerans]MBF9128166.1 alpha/beta hydrolase [Plantactinospora alkalitolerans]